MAAERQAAKDTAKAERQVVAAERQAAKDAAKAERQANKEAAERQAVADERLKGLMNDACSTKETWLYCIWRKIGPGLKPVVFSSRYLNVSRTSLPKTPMSPRCYPVLRSPRAVSMPTW